MLTGGVSGALVVCGAALWPRVYAPLAETVDQARVARHRQTLAVALAAAMTGIAAATVPGLAPLAIVCGVMIATDLAYHHLSLPLQALAVILALARLPAMGQADAVSRIGIGAGLAAIYLAFALFDRSAGLGDVAALAVVGLVAGLAAPVVLTVGMFVPIALVAVGRVGTREPQPLAGWWLAAMLGAAPLVA
jgi:prepilin signal peptidase PulO-like enzyme (type II secretory pathway)